MTPEREKLIRETWEKVNFSANGPIMHVAIRPSLRGLGRKRDLSLSPDTSEYRLTFEKKMRYAGYAHDPCQLWTIECEGLVVDQWTRALW